MVQIGWLDIRGDSFLRPFVIYIQVKDILQSGADIIVFSAHPSLLASSGM